MSKAEIPTRLAIPDYAGMVPRSRLIALFERVRSSAVVLSAPAAYGKTVLAAQMAASARFNGALWIPVPAGCTTAAQVLTAARDKLGGGPDILGSDGLSLEPRPSQAELCLSLEAALNALDAESLCLVLDGLDPKAAAVLSDLSRMSANQECPVVCVVATIRHGAAFECGSVDTLQFEARDLLLDDEEAQAVVAAVVGGIPSSTGLATIIDASGRQPGLLSVLAKCLAAGSGSAQSVLPSHPQIALLLRHLRDSQLSEPQQRMLQSMAILGDGLLDEIAESGAMERASADLMVVAATLPLVTASDHDGPPSFRVHEIAQRAFANPAGMYARDASSLNVLLDRLADRGDEPRLLQLAVDAADVSLLTRWVERVGHRLVARGALGALNAAFVAIPTVTLVGAPRLLLLKAVSEWESGNIESAQRSAQVAREVAEHGCDGAALADALVLLMQIAFGLGDYVLARAYADRAAATQAIQDADARLAHVHGRRLLVNALLGDFLKHAEAEADAACLVGRMRSDDEAAAHLRFFVATSGIAIRGDWAGALPELEAAARCVHLSHSVRISAVFNHCAAAVETGRVSKAGELLNELEALIQAGTSQGASGAARSLREGIDATLGAVGTLAGEQIRAAAASWHVGERLATVTGLSSGSLALLGNRMPEQALETSEQALCYARDMGAPVLVWTAQLEYAAAMLGVGDTCQSVRLASQIHQVVGGSPARSIHLKADIILAEIDCRNGDIEAAAARFREHADYILTESANWQLAMYIRAFPRLLGPLTSALGAADLPVHLLNMILPKYAEEAVAATRDALSAEEYATLATRLLGRPTAGRRAADRAPKSDACTVRLFGGLHVVVAGRVVRDAEWHKRKARLLFAMLVSRCGKDIPREQLTEYLWPEMEATQSLNNLYVIWSAMKHALVPGSGRADKCTYVEHRGGVCRAIHGRVLTDLDEFDEQLAIATKARSAGDAAAELAALRRVAEVYRGELLPGEAYDDWFAALRERCRHDFEDAMLRASTLLEAVGDRQGGLGLLRRALQHDPWREDLYQAALRLQMSAGQRSAAIETYLTCRSRLVDDLGIDPSAETTRLYQQVLCMEDGPVGGIGEAQPED